MTDNSINNSVLDIPVGYHLTCMENAKHEKFIDCDGRWVDITDYPELYLVMGQKAEDGKIQLPNVEYADPPEGCLKLKSMIKVKP